MHMWTSKAISPPVILLFACPWIGNGYRNRLNAAYATIIENLTLQILQLFSVGYICYAAFLKNDTV